MEYARRHPVRRSSQYVMHYTWVCPRYTSQTSLYHKKDNIAIACTMDTYVGPYFRLHCYLSASHRDLMYIYMCPSLWLPPEMALHEMNHLFESLPLTDWAHLRLHPDGNTVGINSQTTNIYTTHTKHNVP